VAGPVARSSCTLALLAALLVAGCGGSGDASSSPATAAGGTTPTSTTTANASTPPRRPRHRAARPRGAAVGATEQVHAGSSTLSVTVTRVLDPLVGDGAAPPSGMRAVGVQVTIRNDRGATYDSTASGDLSVLSSAGPASPLFVKQGVCQTPLADFESLIGAGESRSGCVGFSVPRHARILSVRFSPHARTPGSVAWR
jgi:hypothetical protein